MTSDDRGRPRTTSCGFVPAVQRARKRGRNLWRGRDPEKWESTQFVRKPDGFPTQCVLTSGVVHQRSSHFFGSLLRSQFSPSFSMPAAPQVRSHARSDGGDGGKAAGSARKADRREHVRLGGRMGRSLDLPGGRIGVSMCGLEDGWKGVWICQEGGSA